MKRKSRELNFLKYWHNRQSMEAETSKLRAEHKWLYEIAKGAEKEVDEMLRDAEMQGLRNPAFPDDLVGWLDDDFTLPDDYDSAASDEDEPE